jgi:hypothetical protein
VPSGLLDQLAAATRFEESTRIRFEPAVMAQELATSVELLAAAIQAIPLDRLGRSDAKPLVITMSDRSKSCDKSDVTSDRSDQSLPSCAAGICACFARVSINRDEVVRCSCSRNRLFALRS